MKRFYLTGYVAIEAEDDAEACRLFEEAGLGIEVEMIPGVCVDFQGPWDDVGEIIETPCTCPPDVAERGGFTSTCAACNPGM